MLDAPSNTIVQTTNLQIYIEATIGRGYAGDIAIDDLIITDSSCGKHFYPFIQIFALIVFSFDKNFFNLVEQEVTTPSPAVMKEEFSCDFERDSNLCGLIQSVTDDFDWLPNSGNTGSSGTGPSTDFTTVSIEYFTIFKNVAGTHLVVLLAKEESDSFPVSK